MLKLKSKLNKLVILSLSILINPLQAKTIIWDLGDTLIKADQFAMASQIGIGNLFLHALVDWKNPMDIKDQVFDVLELIENKTNREFTPTYKEKELPEIVCKWLEGKKTGSEICKEVNSFIHNNSEHEIFASNRHKKLIRNSVKAIFHPKCLAKHMNPIKPAIKLLEKCAKNKHRIIIFSNFDLQTFNYLKKLKKTSKIFRNVKSEDIVISGKTGLLKPDPKAYQYLIDKYKLDPKECIIIDDQTANIKTAETFGISGILFEGSRKLEKELKSRKLI